ncbi:PKD domain-containing protein [Hymenobacter metallicola]|uniref:PKD domain-containing protein n=1 Tax=Hymenobacter metallicola TaxID=2563114 RepID=A0A4Z0QCQ9_9BACT|nr:PKD domain-containing protein [Hymenobacter metallicola]TGE27266.1 PKD domain-containing protein [Hymenobacter metallicola]
MSTLFSQRVLLLAISLLILNSCKDKPEDPAPKPTATFTLTSSTCQGTCPVTVKNASQHATKYTWNFGDGTTGTQSEVQFDHAYAQAGTFRVKLLVEGAGGSDTTSRKIVVGSGAACSYSVVPVNSSITTPTTWQSCKVYVVESSVGISNTLTIQPGAVIKFKNGAGLTLTSGGRIEAAGTAAEPIFFTSYLDDARGGDTNGDGTATTPAKKYWSEISLSGQSGSRFEHCQFMYAGSSGSALDLWGAAATVKNCTFTRNGGGAPSFSGTLDAGNSLAGTVIQNNTFYGNELPMRIINLFSLDDSNVFHNPQNTGQTNDYNGIWMEDTSGNSPALTLGETEVPFVMENTGWDAPLTLMPGVTLKMKAGTSVQLNGAGRLLARGTAAQPIVVTSYLDDSHGGDTNHDGNTTAPAKKDWRAVLINGTNGSAFEHCQFLYGGSGGSTLDLFGGSATVTQCTFAHNGEDVSIVTDAALDAYRADAGTLIQGNIFYDNIRPLSITSSFDLDNSNTFHNPVNSSEKNMYQGIIVYWDNNVSKPNVSWGETELAYVNTTDVDVAKNKTLALANNVVLKFTRDVEVILREGTPGQLLNATGTGVLFTSVKDDTQGGDSNGNGAANSPAAGDWEGIYFDTAPGSWAQWSSIRYDKH